MTPQALLRQQLAGVHDILEQTIADCSQHTLDMNPPNATITNIGSIYAHVIFSEDGIVHGLLQKKAPLFHAQGWGSRLNVAMPENPQFDPAWGRTVRMNLAAVPGVREGGVRGHRPLRGRPHAGRPRAEGRYRLHR